MNEFLSYLISSLASGFISVSTAIFILRLQEWRNKKKTFKALYSEVEGNLNIAQKLLPMAESITQIQGNLLVRSSIYNVFMLIAMKISDVLDIYYHCMMKLGNY